MVLCPKKEKEKNIKDVNMFEPAYITTWAQAEPGQWVLAPFSRGSRLSKIERATAYGDRLLIDFGHFASMTVTPGNLVAVLADGAEPERE